MNLRIGDVVHVFVEDFNKSKFLMYISGNPLIFLSINTHSRDGYLEFSNTDCGCLKNNRNFLNCATLIGDEYINMDSMERKGRMTKSLIERILDYIETTDVLSDDERKLVLAEARKAYPK